jgi:23S rRNA pseudouridine1911/1915/1917 synthase
MTQCYEFCIARADADRRLDEFLASRFGSLSRMRIANLVAAGACTIDSAVGSAGHRLAEGELVAISFDEGAPGAMIPEPVPVEVLFEDLHLVVVVKPAGVLVHPTRSVKSGTLANALAYHLNRYFYENPELQTRNPKPQPRHQESGAGNSEPALPAHGEAHSLVRPGMVHRLDRATSGLMVVAKTDEALTRLSIHFRRRLVEKRYRALVRGNVADGAGTIIAPIGRDPNRRPRWWVMESGKPAETRFRVLERFKCATLLELEPVTGRTNQLRVHCAYRGHPIIGDQLYDAVVSGQWPVVSEGGRIHNVLTTSSEATDLWPLTTNQCFPRLLLHAYSLAFHHPATGEWKEFVSPLPADFLSRLETARAES